MSYIQIDKFGGNINIVCKNDDSGEPLLFDTIQEAKDTLNDNCQDGIIVDLNGKNYTRDEILNIATKKFKMNNGFYDTSNIKTIAKRLSFFKYVMMLSHNTIVQTKYHKDNIQYGSREHNRNYTPLQIIKLGGTLHVIDRYIYNQGQIPNSEGEISLVTDKWEFLYCFVTLENLKLIVKKYNLKLKEWQY